MSVVRRLAIKMDTNGNSIRNNPIISLGPIFRRHQRDFGAAFTTAWN